MTDLKCYRCNSWPCSCSDGQTIIHGDCRDVLPLIEADVMVTDPPFGMSHASGWEGPYQNQQIANDGDTTCRDDVLGMWGNRPSLVFGRWTHPVVGAKQALVWDKGEASGMGDLSCPWKPNWELIFVSGNGFSGRRTTGVLVGHTVVTWASKGRCHPNMKPVSLLRELIAKCEGETILDPFLGSGTTLRAAKDLNRRAIGIEIEERYVEIAAKRLEQGVLQFA